MAFEWLAGSCAEAVFGGVVEPGSSADEAVAAEACLDGAAFGLGLSPDGLHLVLRASLLGQLHKYRSAGERLAKELEQRGKIKGKALRRLLKNVPELGREAVAQDIIEAAGDPAVVDLVASRLLGPVP